MKVKCRWCKWIGGMWRCTHPYNGMKTSEFCSWREADDAVQTGRDYCEDYEPEFEEEPELAKSVIMRG